MSLVERGFYTLSLSQRVPYLEVSLYYNNIILSLKTLLIIITECICELVILV